jgi:hypothetical protein
MFIAFRKDRVLLLILLIRIFRVEFLDSFSFKL